MQLGVDVHPHPYNYKDWLEVSLINQVGSACASFFFCVICDCWMVPDGRWCSRTIVGPSDVARVVQLLEDGERLPVVARDLMCPRT